MYDTYFVHSICVNVQFLDVKVEKRRKKITLFKVNSYNKIAWESAVNNTINNQFKSLNYICSEHFLPDDIITDYSIPSDVTEVCKI